MLLLNPNLGIYSIVIVLDLHFNMLLYKPLTRQLMLDRKKRFTFQYASIKPDCDQARACVQSVFTFQYASIKPLMAIKDMTDEQYLHFNMLLLNLNLIEQQVLP